MATFADLMSLLMCFFVLMLAFSEMDAQKFKLLSGSMRNAFGVQAEIEAKTLPKGTSLITKEFTPGKPQPTPLKTVRQFTIQTNANTLKWIDKRDKDVRKIKRALKDEIKKKSISVKVDGERIIIQIREKASFASGDATLKAEFAPTVDKLGGLLGDLEGDITIAGHTDDIPISTARFRSNWELSASRAVSVAHELLQTGEVPPGRFSVTGYADTRPVADNATADGRSKNRRVDITISRKMVEDSKSNDQSNEMVLSADEPDEEMAKAFMEAGKATPEDTASPMAPMQPLDDAATALDTDREEL